MPWKRGGDNGFSYPKLVQIAGFPGAPEYAVLEVYGFINACAELSAAHVTDYVLNTGMIRIAGGSRWKKLLEWSVRAGLLTPVEIDGLPHWTIINDPKFIHLRTQAELDAEDRKRDVGKNPHLAIEARRRDGDNCRYCGIYVMWEGRNSARSGEFDHRDPDKHATCADDLVVACRSCNGARKNNQHDWDRTNPLRPVPDHPNYGEPTATWLSDNGQPTDPNVDHDVLRAQGRKASRSKPAAALTGSAARIAAPEPMQHENATDVPLDEPAAAPSRRSADVDGQRPKPGPKSDSHSFGSGSAGSGRDGRSPRKRRRGRRGRGAPSTPDPCCASPHLTNDPETGVRVCLTCAQEENR